MTDAIAHRGPDGDGLLRRRRRVPRQPAPGDPRRRRRHAADGATRTARSSSSTTARPTTTPSCAGTCSPRGHRLHTTCDTELLPHLYEDEGIEFAARLNGIFAFALCDRKRRQLFLVRDPLGVKPLVYASDGERLAFGSEAKAVLASGLVARRARRGQPAPVDERPLRARRAHVLPRHPPPSARPRPRVRRRAAADLPLRDRRLDPGHRPVADRLDWRASATTTRGGRPAAAVRRARRRFALGRHRLQLDRRHAPPAPGRARSRPSASASTSRRTSSTMPASSPGPTAPTITSSCSTSRR